MDFGELLYQLRTEQGYYQKELASYLNVSIGTVSNYEKGIHYPDLSTLVKIADFFHVSTDYLLQRTNLTFSMESLNQPIYADYTIADLMNTTLQLDRKSMAFLMEYAELLKLKNSVQNTVQTSVPNAKPLPLENPLK